MEKDFAAETNATQDNEISPLVNAHLEQNPETEIPSEKNISTSDNVVTTKSRNCKEESFQEKITIPISPFDIQENFPKLVKTLQSQQSSYKDVYNPIPYKEKENTNNYFFLSLQSYNLIVENLPEVHKKILEKIAYKKDNKIIETWKQGIESVLFKALVAESIKYGQWIAEDISKEYKNKSDLKILELCTGAGITSCMMYLERLNTGRDQTTQIISVDNSIESIACASLLASSFGIPTIISLPESLSQVPKNYKGIIFVIEDAVKFAQEDIQENQVDCVVSDNGISYFPEEIHEQVLKNVKCKLPKSQIYISSLKKGKSVDLNLLFKIRGILQGSKFNTKKTEGQYVEKNGVITETYTSETLSFFTLANKMLKRSGKGGFKDLTKLLGILSSATKSSQDLNAEIATPVSQTRNIAEKIGLEQIKGYPENPLAPCEVAVFKSK